MTLKDLILAPYLAKGLSDDQIKELAAPYFNVTRVDDSKRILTSRSQAAKKGIMKKQSIEDKERQLKALGIID